MWRRVAAGPNAAQAEHRPTASYRTPSPTESEQDEALRGPEGSGGSARAAGRAVAPRGVQ